MAVGNSPGSSDATTYTDWKAANGVPMPETDPDIDDDGRENFLEYAEGTLPLIADESPGTASIETVDVAGVPDDYFVFRFRRNLGADDVIVTAELSSDLTTWRGGSEEIVFLGRERVDASSEDLVFRSADPVGVERRRFGRVRFDLR